MPCGVRVLLFHSKAVVIGISICCALPMTQTCVWPPSPGMRQGSICCMPLVFRLQMLARSQTTLSGAHYIRDCRKAPQGKRMFFETCRKCFKPPRKTVGHRVSQQRKNWSCQKKTTRHDGWGTMIKEPKIKEPETPAKPKTVPHTQNTFGAYQSL